VNPNAPFSPRAGFVPAPASFQRAVPTLTIVGAILVVLLFVVFALPVPHHYSFVVNEAPNAGGWFGEINRSFPENARVTGSWSSFSGGSTQIQIAGSDLAVIYLGYGSSGAFSFTSHGLAYQFIVTSDVNATVMVSGTFSVPLV
jgi:hypothetical protein